jgi:hypothetical protein
MEKYKNRPESKKKSLFVNRNRTYLFDNHIWSIKYLQKVSAVEVT